MGNLVSVYTTEYTKYLVYFVPSHKSDRPIYDHTRHILGCDICDRAISSWILGLDSKLHGLNIPWTLF
jgi:hypothetical protein